jgi:phosphohistidine phosphatase
VRSIYLLRHAKTEMAGPEQPDAERALTARGEADAAIMGQHIAARTPSPELVLCSTARRTRQTLAHMGLTLPTELQATLYLASPGDMLAAIQEADDAVGALLLIGHNPGIHELTALLTAEAANEHDLDRLSMGFPTCTLATLQCDAPHWRDVAPGACLLRGIHTTRA